MPGQLAFMLVRNLPNHGCGVTAPGERQAAPRNMTLPRNSMAMLGHQISAASSA